MENSGATLITFKKAHYAILHKEFLKELELELERIDFKFRGVKTISMNSINSNSLTSMNLKNSKCLPKNFQLF